MQVGARWKSVSARECENANIGRRVSLLRVALLPGNNLRLRFCSTIRIVLARCRATAHDLVGLAILSIIWQSTAGHNATLAIINHRVLPLRAALVRARLDFALALATRLEMKFERKSAPCAKEITLINGYIVSFNPSSIHKCERYVKRFIAPEKVLPRWWCWDDVDSICAFYCKQKMQNNRYVINSNNEKKTILTNP